MADFDLVLRGGTILDGSGGAPFRADVAVRGDRIVEVGEVAGRGAQEIDARGCLVTPGFIDVHTHYDGQVTWENRLAPSSNHGVTTVVMGNCGVGFAPCRSDQKELAIRLMEGVEDIPQVVMSTGLPWNWETFPEYLDALEQRRTDVDFAAQLPHSPLRVYVMGERGADREPPTDAELAEMRRLTAEAVKAGALGVTTSRQLAHRFRDGKSAPSVNTEVDEILALAGGLKDAGAGVFQIIGNSAADPKAEFSIFRELVRASGGRPLSFTTGLNEAGAVYAEEVERAHAEGLPIRGQFMPRPVGMLMGLDLSYHPFALNPSYRPLADLPLPDKVAALRGPELRARLIAEQPDDPNPFLLALVQRTDPLFVLGDPPNYAPAPEQSLRARAEAAGVPLRALIYDALLEQDGQAILYAPLGGDPSADPTPFLQSSAMVVALGDGGAHYGMICDAAYPTFVLTRLCRDKAEGRGVELPEAIRALTRKPAELAGLLDRGQIAPGLKADLNVIDLDDLRLYAPRVARDLPAGGKRLRQRADGYRLTMVSGEITYRDGEPTGALPGRLVRGARQPPQEAALAV